MCNPRSPLQVFYLKPAYYARPYFDLTYCVPRFDVYISIKKIKIQFVACTGAVILAKIRFLFLFNSFHLFYLNSYFLKIINNEKGVCWFIFT